MIKKLILAMAFMIGMGLNVAAAKYVRKQPEPNFFIPESARQQPEKLPLPKYTAGQEESVKMVEPEKPAPRRGVISPEASQIVDTVTKPVEEIPSDEDLPDFQHKFDNYSRDLEQISRNGQIPANPALEEDLNQMNSDQRIVVNHQAYQPRNSKAKFNQALQNSLNND